MTYHRGLLFWGLALITGGMVALAAQQHYLDGNLLIGMWRLWPLILVAIGLSILLSRTRAAIVATVIAALVTGTAGGVLIAVGPGSFNCGGADPTTLTTRQGTFGNMAQVQLDINCGTLSVGMENRGIAADGNQWTVAFGHSGGSEPAISSDSNRLGVRSPTDSWFDHGRQSWNVTLPTGTRYEWLEIMPNAADTKVDLGGGTFTIVSVHPNAGSLRLDLTNAQIRELGMSLNAGSASILVGNGTKVHGSLSVNAGSIELCTKGALSIHLTVEDNITFATNLDGTNLAHAGNAWSYSPSYPPGAVVSSVDLHIDGNAGSFDLNPAGGCS